MPQYGKSKRFKGIADFPQIPKSIQGFIESFCRIYGAFLRPAADPHQSLSDLWAGFIFQYFFSFFCKSFCQCYQRILCRNHTLKKIPPLCFCYMAKLFLCRPFDACESMLKYSLNSHGMVCAVHIHGRIYDILFHIRAGPPLEFF